MRARPARQELLRMIFHPRLRRIDTDLAALPATAQHGMLALGRGGFLAAINGIRHVLPQDGRRVREVEMLRHHPHRALRVQRRARAVVRPRRRHGEEPRRRGAAPVRAQEAACRRDVADVEVLRPPVR